MRARRGLRLVTLILGAGSLTLAACSPAPGQVAVQGQPDVVNDAAASPPVPHPAITMAAETTVLATTAVASTVVATTVPRLDLYAFTRAGMLAPKVAAVTPMVYVPNTDARSITIINPATGDVVLTAPVGLVPHHVTPSWDLSTLYVLDTAGNAIYPITPGTTTIGAGIPVEDPYNLYFSPDGRYALVIAERYQRIDIRDPSSWKLLHSIAVPHPGVNHGDFSPDGRYFYASCEFSGWVVKVDLVELRLVVEAKVGVEPIDVKFSPDGTRLFVADQARAGVIVLDPGDLHEIGFIPTARGTHGLYPSRDGAKLYATNRLGSSVSVIDFATQQVVATWTIPNGGSPDMGSVSADGSQFWVSGRYHGEVYVFDTSSGTLTRRIKTGAGAHGLTYFPQPGRFSMGHTGNFR